MNESGLKIPTTSRGAVRNLPIKKDLPARIPNYKKCMAKKPFFREKYPISGTKSINSLDLFEFELANIPLADTPTESNNLQLPHPLHN